MRVYTIELREVVTLQLWVNWRTKITHLSRDCHQLARIPEGTAWLEMEEGSGEDLTGVGRRYCGWCVSRVVRAADRAGGFVMDAELHSPAERADYISAEKVVQQRSEAAEEARLAAEASA